jgi:hypothetical protein
VRNLLRAAAALAVAAMLLAFLGLPLCSSEVCPMSAAERAGCKAMGRECCGTKGGQVAHAPSLPVPAPAVAPAVLALAAPAAPLGAAFADPTRATAAPAVLQGLGLFTLLSVFLI